MTSVTFFSTVRKDKLSLEGYSLVDLKILQNLFDEVYISNSIFNFRFKSEIYFSWWASGSIIPLIYSFVFSRPIIVIAGGTEAVEYFDTLSGKPYGYSAFGLLKRRIIRIVLSKANAVVFVSNSQFADRVKVLNRLSIVIPNAIDSRIYKYSPLESYRDARYDVMCIFNFDESVLELKRGYLVLEIIKDISKIIPGIRVVIIGNVGNGLVNFVNEIRRYGLVDNIHIHHNVSNDNIIEFYKGSKVFLHASDYETFGMSVAEAMSLGRPVLVSDVESLKELVGEEYKYIFKRNDKSMAVALLLNLLRLNVLDFNKIGDYLSNRINSNFSFETRHLSIKNLISKFKTKD